MSPTWVTFAVIALMAMGSTLPVEGATIYDDGWSLFIPVVKTVPQVKEANSQPLEPASPQFLLASSKASATASSPGQAGVKTSAGVRASAGVADGGRYRTESQASANAQSVGFGPYSISLPSAKADAMAYGYDVYPIQ